MGKTRKKYLFSGEVQGVGFRYTVRGIAKKYSINGFVRNLTDGRVEMIGEGSDSELNDIINDIKKKMGSSLKDISIHEEEPLGDDKGFEIQF